MSLNHFFDIYVNIKQVKNVILEPFIGVSKTTTTIFQFEKSVTIYEATDAARINDGALFVSTMFI